MNEVKVLIDGYAKEIEDGWIASSTVTLVKSNDKNIIVDPGCNRIKLIEALKKEGLETKDIDLVLLTHDHTDHILLAGIFEKAKVLTPYEIYDGDTQIRHKNKIPDADVKIIQTPGHARSHISFLVKTEKGSIVIAGDLWWWKDDEKQETDYDSLIEKNDPYVRDKDILIKTREKILEIADYIIPGHGKMFNVRK